MELFIALVVVSAMAAAVFAAVAWGTRLGETDRSEDKLDGVDRAYLSNTVIMPEIAPHSTYRGLRIINTPPKPASAGVVYYVNT